MDQPTTATWVDALSRSTDEDLCDLACLVRDEQRRRALESEDLAAVIDDAFDRGFDGRGMALDPWITSGGLVVCPGSKIHRSRQSHRCRFVAVGDTWVWESAERVTDELRSVGDGRDSVQTVTVLAGWDGLLIDVVTSKASGGSHTRESSSGWLVQGGELVPSAPSGSGGGDHRR